MSHTQTYFCDHNGSDKLDDNGILERKTKEDIKLQE